MKYIHRALENQIQQAMEQFPVVVLTGPRQSGKSTLLQHLYPNYPYHTFDDPILRRQAQDDPGLFLETVPSPAILDEIQSVPELLPYIKMQVDQNRAQKGQYILTGSQIFQLMSGLTETLAGRAALFELLPFSRAELGVQKSMTLPELFELLYKGFYPDPCVHNVNARLFYASYLQTYLERDIRQVMSVQELSDFQRFVELLAARSGSLLNISEVSRDCGISHTTGKRWLSLLETSRIVYLLRPYYANIGKRVIKSPKLYFTDTGLLAYLLKYPDSATYLSGPMGGNVFENFLIIEMLKDKLNNSHLYELYYLRDSNGGEIDLVIDAGEQIHAVEIKMRQNIRKEDARSLEKFSVEGKTIFRWLVSCYPNEIKLTPLTRNVPWWKVSEIVVSSGT